MQDVPQIISAVHQLLLNRPTGFCSSTAIGVNWPVYRPCVSPPIFLRPEGRQIGFPGITKTLFICIQMVFDDQAVMRMLIVVIVHPYARFFSGLMNGFENIAIKHTFRIVSVKSVPLKFTKIF